MKVYHFSDPSFIRFYIFSIHKQTFYEKKLKTPFDLPLSVELKIAKSQLKVQLIQSRANRRAERDIQDVRTISFRYDRNNTGNITSRTLKFLLRGLGDNVSEE